MPVMLFTRPNEERKTDAFRTLGIVIIGPDGVRYFVPGWDADLTMMEVRAKFPVSLLEHANTTIQFGRADEGYWAPTRTLKAPVDGG